MKLDLYQQSGEKKGTVEASDALFKGPVRAELMRLAVLRHLSNARQANAHTKSRGEVRGGGRKPRAQKHTGGSRQGSIRSPLWKGGGVAFGPKNVRNYEKRMPKQARRQALFSSLSQKASENAVFALDAFTSKEPKTRLFVEMLKKLPFKRSLLVVIPERDAVIEKSAANLPKVQTVTAGYLNVYDVLKAEKIMFLEPALKKAETLFLK